MDTRHGTFLDLRPEVPRLKSKKHPYEHQHRKHLE